MSLLKPGFVKLFWGANIEEFYKELKHPWEVLNSRIQNEFFLEDNKLKVSNYSERYKHLLSFFNIVWLVDFQWLEACCTVKPQFMKGKPFCWPRFLYPFPVFAYVAAINTFGVDCVNNYIVWFSDPKCVKSLYGTQQCQTR